MKKFVKLLLLALILGTPLVANNLRLLQPGGKNNEASSTGFCIDPWGGC